jgi:nucleoside-diphosphate-sugar epimerase
MHLNNSNQHWGHVLVTGGAGYIGSTVTELLLARGYEVTVLDRFFFGNNLLDLQNNPKLHLVKADIRTASQSVFKGVDAVFDLAALSNDPAGELDPNKTLEINYQGRERICRLAKENGVRRYLLASSCSIYGFQDETVDEGSSVKPLTTYAHANRLAEKSNLAMASETFSVTALRQATAYGLSRRMRFDIAINGMTLALFKRGSVRIMRDGTQWRPLVHVRDISRAFITVLESPPAKVNGEIFNVGSDNQNLQILPLAERLSAAVNIPFKEDWYGDVDKRSYRVNFRKICDVLGYRTELTPEDGAKEIFAGLKNGTVTDSLQTRTVDWYKSLIEWHNITREVEMNGGIL